MKKISLKTVRSKDAVFWAKVSLLLFVTISWVILFIDFNVLFNNRYNSLRIVSPSRVEEGQEFDFTIEAWDDFERLAGANKGEIEFDLESYNITSSGYSKINSPHWKIKSEDFKFSSNFIWSGFFPAYKFVGADNGKKNFAIQISTPGIHFIKVTDKDTGETYRSNPIRVYPDGTDFEGLYWGDIHAHSSLSDGSGTVEDNYIFARDVALLDFAAVTDHSEMFPQFGRTPLFNTFEEYIRTTNSFNEDGEFATLVAMEWTPLLPQQRSYLSNQHTNIYLSGDDLPFYSTFVDFTPYELYDYVEENSEDDFIGWTHHVMRSDYGSDYAFYDKNVNTMIEIYSEHGCGEFSNNDLNIYPTTHSFEDKTRGYSVNDGLRMGRKFGIMASSDSHDGRMGHPIVHTEARGAIHVDPFSISAYKFGVYPGGLTGLYSPKLDRSHVFEAFQSRSAYATTWVNRHYMEFNINGLSIGENDSTLVVPKKDSTRTIEILIAADGISLDPEETNEISSIQIVKNSEIWKEWKDINKPIQHLIINDTSDIIGTSYDHCKKRDDGKWYIHARSLQPVDPDELNTGGADYYYIRMIDSNPVRPGMAWIGPIWVEIQA